jgi:uncharacterized membrane protein YuzA (DUF378 family)
MIHRVRYAIIAAAGVIGLAAMTVHSVLDNTYVNYTRVANPDAGLIVPYVVKGGAIVYITSTQRLILDCLNWTLFGLAPVILISLLLSQKMAAVLEKVR